jgi:hypothetical protein
MAHRIDTNASESLSSWTRAGRQDDSDVRDRVCLTTSSDIAVMHDLASGEQAVTFAESTELRETMT